MDNKLTKDKLKGLWARKDYIFKEEENQKIIKRFSFWSICMMGVFYIDNLFC